ncbi:MAG: hypothetical protein WBB45_00020 [Cyclobacteriaceae bacterium]
MAIERDLEIIGEAVNRILKTDPSFVGQIINVRSIVSLRNQVIHSIQLYNDDRPHLSIGMLTPDVVHQTNIKSNRLWKTYYKKYKIETSSTN